MSMRSRGGASGGHMPKAMELAGSGLDRAGRALQSMLEMMRGYPLEGKPGVVEQVYNLAEERSGRLVRAAEHVALQAERAVDTMQAVAVKFEWIELEEAPEEVPATGEHVVVEETFDVDRDGLFEEPPSAAGEDDDG